MGMWLMLEKLWLILLDKFLLKTYLIGDHTPSTPYGEGFIVIGTGKLADLSENGDIDFEDFAMLAEDWQKPQGQYVGDITGASGIPDGYVDGYDLEEFMSQWLE